MTEEEDKHPGDEPEGDEDARGHWPPEYGGRGATLIESAIFFEEQKEIEAVAREHEAGVNRPAAG